MSACSSVCLYFRSRDWYASRTKSASAGVCSRYARCSTNSHSTSTTVSKFSAGKKRWKHTFIGGHHLATNKLLKCLVALHVKCKGFHEALFGLITSVKLQHEQTSQVAHRRLNLHLTIRLIGTVPKTLPDIPLYPHPHSAPADLPHRP